mmetsp:Transcript_1345/g.1596  ORF Transcript_1345/g.1596 Transcript_1345/m.1596 type:complete len:262 (+) Transcript_1345:172-957(+)
MKSQSGVSYRQVKTTEEDDEPGEVELGTLSGDRNKNQTSQSSPNSNKYSSTKKELVWDISDEQGCLAKISPFVQVEGNNFLLYGNNRGTGRSWPMHCIMGPDWCCSFFTTGLIVGISLWWFAFISAHLEAVYSFIGIITFSMLFISYSKTAYSDPGIIRKQTREELESQPKGEGTLCNYCNIYRTYATRHCYDCNACIYDHDHHCPWTGKCIGGNNITYFNVFICSLFTHLIYVLITWIVGMSDVPISSGHRRHHIRGSHG